MVSYKTDADLGKKVRTHLVSLGLETTISEYAPRKGDAHSALRGGVVGFLNYMNLDMCDPSIADTPDRVADMYVNELCYGLDYTNFPKCTTTPNGREVTEERSPNQLHVGTPLVKKWLGRADEMVMVESIQTISLCEHHFQTISGVTHIAYIPNNKLLGLSKFARVTDFFARRPQIQERMTEQTFAALCLILETEDIAVVQDCIHFCMKARGVQDPNSRTTTSKLGGRFRTNPALRSELFARLPK